MERKDLRDEETFAAVSARLEALRPDTPPRWGTMDAGRMLAHCAEVVEVFNGKPLDGTPFFVRLLGPLIKRVVLSDKKYPRGTRTHPQYLVVDEQDFAAQKARLLAGLAELRRRGDRPGRHPIFGTLSPAETSWGVYKHLDHHLTQFGV